MSTFLISVDYSAKTEVQVEAKNGEEALDQVEEALFNQLLVPIDSFTVTHLEVLDTKDEPTL